MRKIQIAFIMYLIVTGFLYADDRFSIAIDWMTDSVYIRRFFGAYSEKGDTGSGNPYRYQGDGITKSFQTSMFDEGIKGRIGLAYNGAKIGGSFSLRMDRDTAFNDFVEWSSWLRFGADNDSFNMRVLAGHNEQKGRLGNFGIMFPVWRKQDNYIPNNFFSSTIGFPFGYSVGGTDMGFVEFYQTETSDVFMPAGTNARKLLNVLADFNFKPLTLTLASGGLYAKDAVPLVDIYNGSTGEEIRGDIYDAVYDPATLGGMNYAVRVESAKIADLVTIGAAYKFTSSIFSKIYPTSLASPYSPENIIDENKSNHAYGLFAVFTPLDTLSISAGYSGLYQTWKNPQYKDTFVAAHNEVAHWLSNYSEAVHPLFHGVDLRAAYTGIEKLTLSFNNNLTVASVRGLTAREYEDGKFSLGWAYREHLGNRAGEEGSGRSERYIGVTNELDLLFALNERINIGANVNSQLGLFTLLGRRTDDNPTSYSHYLNVKAGVGYTIFDTLSIKGVIWLGFIMRLANYSFQDAQTMDTFKAGLVEMAVPLMFSLQF